MIPPVENPVYQGLPLPVAETPPAPTAEEAIPIWLSAGEAKHTLPPPVYPLLKQ